MKLRLVRFEGLEAEEVDENEDERRKAYHHGILEVEVVAIRSQFLGR